MSRSGRWRLMFRVCATDERGVKAEIKVAETGPPMLFTSLVILSIISLQVWVRTDILKRRNG
jgi:hypothetical protein